MLNSKEIYVRISQNIELLNLYTSVNEQIILKNPQSELFTRVTQTLSQIREVLDKIEIKMTFQHMWFPSGRFHSFWAYYNKINIETEKQTEGPVIRRFLNRQRTPRVVKN